MSYQPWAEVPVGSNLTRFHLRSSFSDPLISQVVNTMARRDVESK